MLKKILINQFIKCGAKLINLPMSRLTTIGIGGYPLALLEVNSDIQATEIIQLCIDNGVKHYFVGNGSKLLCADNLSKVVIIKFANNSEMVIKDNIVTATAGMLTSRVFNIAKENNLGGMEYLKCLPASLGGAVAMNAGCFGNSISQLVYSVDAIVNGELTTFSQKSCQFDYRDSVFLHNDAFIISAKLMLAVSEQSTIEKIHKEMIFAKRQSQPLDSMSAGSIFKATALGSAAKLIDQAKLKGLRVGGAVISPKHAGFIVNEGNATEKDVKILIDIITKKIYNIYNTQLSLELRLIE